MIEQIREIFLSEASGQLELIDAISSGEDFCGDDNKVVLIQRAMHSMKGSAPMFGFQHVADLALAVEQTYKRFIINNIDSVPYSVMIQTRQAASVIRECLSTLETPCEEVLQRKKELIDYFNQLQ